MLDYAIAMSSLVIAGPSGPVLSRTPGTQRHHIGDVLQIEASADAMLQSADIPGTMPLVIGR